MLTRKSRLVWALLLALALPALPASAAAALKVRPPRLVVRQHQLDNGLKILLHEDHSVPLVNLQVWYHVGSKNERPGRTGFAHLFEHLMFKGSANVGVEEHKTYIQSIGGRYNATTDADRTLYYETFPSNYLEHLLWMEADRMQSLDVSEQNFQSEREVVKEERRLRVDNPPFGHLFETVFASSFTTHPYHMTPIGSMADLDAATIEDVREFYRTYYVPNNATLVISGDVDPEQAFGWVRKYFGPIAMGKPIARALPQEPPQTAERRVVRYDTKAPLPVVMMTYHIPKDGHPDLYALGVASDILSSGHSSRLYRKMVYEQQTALAAGGELEALEDPGLFYFDAILKGGQTPQAGEKSLLEEVERLQSQPVSSEELEKAKNQFISSLVFGRQSVQQKGDAIGHASVILGDVEEVNTELAEYQKVTAADVQRVAKQYFQPQNCTVIYMLPEALRPAAGGDAKGDGKKGAGR
jgi:zinc protease